MIGRLALLAAVIGAVVVAAQWSLQAGEDAEPAAAAAEPAPAPFLRAAVLEDFDAAGRLRLRVDAARIEFDPADESLGFEAIALDYFAGPSQTWRVNADRGHAPRRFHHLHARAHHFDRYGSQTWLRRQSGLDVDSLLAVLAGT